MKRNLFHLHSYRRKNANWKAVWVCSCGDEAPNQNVAMARAFRLSWFMIGLHWLVFSMLLVLIALDLHNRQFGFVVWNVLIAGATRWCYWKLKSREEAFHDYGY